MLGHHPDEFGLVPDPDGFIPYKELLQALHQETGWSHIRLSHLNEVLMGKHRSLFETSDKGLRVVERKWQFESESNQDLVPGILFSPIRQRAHPVVMEKGLSAPAGKQIVLSSDREMAKRIGERKDHSPVILEVMARKAASQGLSFKAFGRLFLNPRIPPQFIAGPKVAKEILSGRQASQEKKEKRKSELSDFSPGSLILDLKMEQAKGKRGRGKKRKGWKEEARKLRKRD